MEWPLLVSSANELHHQVPSSLPAVGFCRGSHQPLERLSQWPPMTTRVPWVSLSVTTFAEVPSTLGTPAPTTPGPSRSTQALMGHLLFQEVHTPIHGHGVEVLSPPASRGMVTCDLAWKTMRKQQPGGHPNKTNTSSRPEWSPPATGLPSKALGTNSPAPPLPFPQPLTSRLHGQ